MRPAIATSRRGWIGSRRCRPEAEIRPISRLLFAAYFLEVGLILIVAPWSVFWQHNFFADVLPSLEPLIHNNFVRGAVSGLGLVTVLAGLAELVGVLASRRRSGESLDPERIGGS
jgi:hypothetical protein